MSTARIAPPPPVEFELLPEPTLMFGGSTMARDPKAGLALAGPAGLDTTLHPTEIDIALIGTGNISAIHAQAIKDIPGAELTAAYSVAGLEPFAKKYERPPRHRSLRECVRDIRR